VVKKDPLLNQVRRLVTATLVFVLAYLVCIITHQVVTGLVCTILEYKPTITFNAILGLPIDAQYWSKFRVTAIFGAGALWLFIQSIIAFSAFSSYKSGATSMFRNWLLWLGILSANYLLVIIITLPAGDMNVNWSLYQGLAMIAMWWYIPVFITWPIAIVAALLSLLFGYLISPLILRFMFSSKAGSFAKGRKGFLISHYILPIILGTLMIVPLLNSYSWSLHAALVSNLLYMSIGIFLRSEYLKLGVMAQKQDVLNRWPSVLSIITLIIYATIGLWYR
jgi:hypothetical protein